MDQHNDFDRIKNSEYTCIVENDNKVIFTSADKGVKPLIDYISENKDYIMYDNITIIDRIMGKGAMCLAIKCKARKVITPIISQKALDLAKLYKINLQYEKVVPYVINRTGTGPCPIEEAVTNTDDIEIAYNIIIDTLNQLRKG